MKTNVTRILDGLKIEHIEREYDPSITNGELVAKALNQDSSQVFKTLVTIASDKNHYVFCIPVNGTLDLKKAAKVANVKSLEMIKQKDLLPLTGYIHGGCSPIGMKKQFKTFIDETASLFDTFCISGGRVGYQIEISLDNLSKVINFELADVAIL